MPRIYVPAVPVLLRAPALDIQASQSTFDAAEWLKSKGVPVRAAAALLAPKIHPKGQYRPSLPPWSIRPDYNPNNKPDMDHLLFDPKN